MAPRIAFSTKSATKRAPADAKDDRIASLINSTIKKSKSEDDSAIEPLPGAPAPPRTTLSSVMNYVRGLAPITPTASVDETNTGLGDKARQSYPEVQIPTFTEQAGENLATMRTRKRTAEESDGFEHAAKRLRLNKTSPQAQQSNQQIEVPRTQPRKDIYDVPSDSEAEKEDEGRVVGVKRASKGSKATAKVSKPAVKGAQESSKASLAKSPQSKGPRSSGATTRSSGTRQESSTANTKNGQPLPKEPVIVATHVTRSLRSNTARADIESQAEATNKVTNQQDQSDKQHDVRVVNPGDQPSLFVSQQYEQDEEQVEEGLTGVLVDPSPKKPEQLRVANENPTHSSVSDNEFSVHSGSSVAEISEDEVSEDGVEEPVEVGLAVEAREFAQDQADHELLYEMTILDKMWRRAKLVGESTGKVRKKKVLRQPVTELGAQIFDLVKELSTIFKDANSNEVEDLVEGVETAQQVLRSVREAVDEACGGILSQQKRDTQSLRLLLDVYFLLLPNVHEVLWNAASLYTLRKDIPTSSLGHLNSIVSLLLKLSSQAIKHTKAPLEPGAKRRRRSYQYSQPTKTNIPTLKILSERLTKEVVSRHEIAEREAHRKLVLEEKLERARLEKREKEHRFRKEEAGRMQIQEEIDANEERRREKLASNFDHPILGRLLRQQALQVLERQRNEIIAAGKLSQFVNSQSRSTELASGVESSVESSDGEGEVANEDDIERVSLFDPHDKVNTPPPWTEEEKIKFIKIMRAFSTSETKYISVAEELDKTVEEVHEYAKDLQQSMNDAHQRGEFTGPQHQWTRIVWNPTIHV